MKFIIKTEKGTEIEMQSGLTIEIEIDGKKYEIGIKEI